MANGGRGIRSWEYVDFSVEIREGSEANKYVMSVRSPAGEVREEMHFPFDKAELENRVLRWRS